MKAIVITEDERLLNSCSQIAQKVGIDWTTEQHVADLLLRIQKMDFNLILFDCERFENDCLKWLEHVHALRPRIPIITTCTSLTREMGASMLDLGILHIAQKPINNEPLIDIIEKMKRQLLNTR
ncbi:MAG: hypothetical protein H6696_18290 [Deferribacteres bacterium]|nr:hypothetical protein [candidate division KSB1 bacterium]MCB9503877.1 hypothetical protein [Deferribacteres bacterium]